MTRGMREGRPIPSGRKVPRGGGGGGGGCGVSEAPLRAVMAGEGADEERDEKPDDEGLFLPREGEHAREAQEPLAEGVLRRGFHFRLAF